MKFVTFRDSLGRLCAVNLEKVETISVVSALGDTGKYRVAFSINKGDDLYSADIDTLAEAEEAFSRFFASKLD